MRLTLGIATSGGVNSIAIGAAGRLLWRSEQLTQQDGPPESLAGCVTAGLGTLGVDAGAIAALAVDIGPGGLGATRCGVAFANALGFGLNIPIWPLRSFTIIAAGIQADRADALPVVCIAPAADGQVYAGLSRGAALAETLRFGPPETVIPRLTAGLRHFVAAGKARHHLSALRPDAVIADSGIDGPVAAWMLPLVPASPREALAAGAQALPVTEHDPALQA